jgi:hypothetical protein
MTIAQTSNLTSIYDRWVRPSYEVRVRGTTYLWGSAGIKTDINFDKALVLHLRNDLFGSQVTLQKQAESGPTPIGTLDPGEAVSIQLNQLTGVSASCESESVVACVINQ